MPTGLLSRTTKSEKAGLKFSVSRIKTMLMFQERGQRVSDSAAVYMAAVLEYLTSEIIELSLNAAHSERKHRIQPHHMNVVMRQPEAGPVFRQPVQSAVVPKSNLIATGELTSISQVRRCNGSCNIHGTCMSAGWKLLGKMAVPKIRKAQRLTGKKTVEKSLSGKKTVTKILTGKKTAEKSVTVKSVEKSSGGNSGEEQA